MQAPARRLKTWLNDPELERTLCRSSLPFLTGLGHGGDETILDEVARGRFGTPSKFVSYDRRCRSRSITVN